MLDGAMGTMIQTHGLREADYRGVRFADWPVDLKGNNDLLVLTQPALIEELHGAYCSAGADLITTNTFNAQRISLADYGMQHLAYEMNLAAAQVARRAVDAGLGPWTDRWDRDTLAALLPAADRLSCLHRAESWARLRRDVPVRVVDDNWVPGSL